MSLGLRLFLIAALWCAAVLTLAGWALSTLYSRSITDALDRELSAVLENLTTDIEWAENQLALEDPPNDPRFNHAFSGRYWTAIADLGAGAQSLAESRSLWDEGLILPAPFLADLKANPGNRRAIALAGPNGEPLRVLATAIALSDPARGDLPIVLAAAADRREGAESARNFALTIGAAFAALTLGMIGAVAAQVRWGLAPLRDLEAEVAAVRNGRVPRLGGPHPREVRPLAAELNGLIDSNRDIVERARTHVGNLAHALKTPIAVLLNEARAHEDLLLSPLVIRQADAMRDSVEHYLRRAQAAARAEAFGARCEARLALEDLVRLHQKLYAREGVQVRLEPGPSLFFRGERQDFDDLAGNLLDNACKYGGGLVEARLNAQDADFLRLIVEDDGAGLTADEQAAALKRGVRLDETAPGSGLGLSIVDELARAYGGSLKLGQSDLGGLRAELTLPRVD